jgi:hypothetical protein
MKLNNQPVCVLGDKVDRHKETNDSAIHYCASTHDNKLDYRPYLDKLFDCSFDFECGRRTPLFWESETFAKKQTLPILPII